MIARHHQGGHRDGVDEGAGVAELLRLGPLGEVAREDQQVGLALLDQGAHRGGGRGHVKGTEMNVGDVEDLTHAADRSVGEIR